MEIDGATVRASAMYQHLIRVIAPRPIAWVSTVSLTGRLNLAPFSFFTGVGSRPPSVLFCPSNRRDGSPKDTLKNVLETGEFVINVVSASLTEAMNQSSAELPADESEFDLTGLVPASSRVVRAPGVERSPVRIECRLLHHLSLDEGPGGANIVVGSIVHMFIDDKMLDGTGYADPDSLDLIGRLGGSTYCRTRDHFELQRP